MEKWLTKHKFIAGDEMTIADLSASHELDMLKFLRYDLSRWPHVEKWLFTTIDSNPVQLECSKRVRLFAKNWADRNLAKAKL